MSRTCPTQDRASRLANVVLLFGALAFVALSAYAHTRARHWPAGSMVRYYIIALLGVVGCGVGYRLRPRYKVGMVLLLAPSVLLGVYLCQVFAACSDYLDARIRYGPLVRVAAQQRRRFDTRTKPQVFEDLRAQGLDPYPCLRAMSIVASPDGQKPEQCLFTFGSVSGKLTITDNETGEWGKFESDERGFNNPAGLFSGTVDVAVVGDSFAHGIAVQTGEDMASCLRDSGLAAVNLGCPRAGPLAELGVLTEYVRELKPPAVLWLYCEENDVTDLARELNTPVLPNYLDPGFSQQLASRQAEVDELLTRYARRAMEQAVNEQRGTVAKIAMLWHIRGLLGLHRTPRPRFPVPDEALFEKLAQILRSARDRTTSWGGRLCFVYLPCYGRYGKVQENPNYGCRDKVLSIVRDLSIPVLDLAKTFDDHPDALSLFPFRVRSHYNKEGYRFAAQTIAAFLRDRL